MDVNKTYVVVREHNGVYEQIPAVYDKAFGTLTFESDKFSDYALATVNENGTTTPTEPSKPEETNPNTGNDTKSPQTGDNSNMGLWFALLFVSCGGIIGTAVCYRKKKSTR